MQFNLDIRIVAISLSLFFERAMLIGMANKLVSKPRLRISSP